MERQFLKKSDLKDIQYDFGRHFVLRIQVAASDYLSCVPSVGRFSSVDSKESNDRVHGVSAKLPGTDINTEGVVYGVGHSLEAEQPPQKNN